jgi:hypothetical protein
MDKLNRQARILYAIWGVGTALIIGTAFITDPWVFIPMGIGAVACYALTFYLTERWWKRS